MKKVGATPKTCDINDVTEPSKYPSSRHVMFYILCDVVFIHSVSHNKCLTEGRTI